MAMIVFARNFLLVLLLAGIALPQFPTLKPLLSVDQAQAQEKKKRKTLFDVLFKRRKNKKRNTRTNTRTSRSDGNLPGVRIGKKNQAAANNKARPSTGQRATSNPKPVILVEKNENARKLLVLGDFIGGGVAKGLTELYANNADLVVINATKSNSGIVRDDVIDWRTSSAELIKEHQPAAVIALMGMNDRQAIRTANGRAEKLTDEWKAEYVSRILTITKASISARVPILWIGLPPVNSGRMNADYLAFNKLYQGVTETTPATFVDVWDGFTNAEGKFVTAGPGVNGQIVRLRGSRGINMTRAGRAKLAFFADKELRRVGIIGDNRKNLIASLGFEEGTIPEAQIPEYDPAGTGKTIIISLGSPALDGGAELEGSKGFRDLKTTETSESEALVQKGIAVLPHSGRVDAGWGRPTEPVKPAKPAPPEDRSTGSAPAKKNADPSLQSQPASGTEVKASL